MKKAETIKQIAINAAAKLCDLDLLDGCWDCSECGMDGECRPYRIVRNAIDLALAAGEGGCDDDN